MRNEGITWKFMLCMMASGFVVCLLVLFILYAERGYLNRSEIIGVIGGFVFSCVLLVVANRSWQGNTRKVDSHNKGEQQ